MRRPNPPVPPVTIATDPLRSTDPPRPRRWAKEAYEAPVRNPSVLGGPAPQRREEHPGHQREQEEHRVRHEFVQPVRHTSPQVPASSPSIIGQNPPSGQFSPRRIQGHQSHQPGSIGRRRRGVNRGSPKYPPPVSNVPGVARPRPALTASGSRPT